MSFENQIWDKKLGSKIFFLGKYILSLELKTLTIFRGFQVNKNKNLRIDVIVEMQSIQ